MPIFEVAKDRFIPLQPTSFSSHGLRERADLQRLLRDQPEIIAPDVMIISEEFCDWEDSKRRIDLLVIDRSANLVVVELKRTDDGGHMELQAIRYAAMVSKMTFDKAVDVFGRYLSLREREADPRTTILDFLRWDAPEEEKFAQDVRIVLASAEFSRELTSAVMWLIERGIDIRCVRLRPQTDGQRVFVDVQQVLPLPEASDYFVNLREKKEEERQSRRRESQWSGLFFVNIGMDHREDHPVESDGALYQRHWDHCVRLGYVAAGGAPRYSDYLKKLAVGDQIVAYQKGAGYVGHGEVIRPAEPLHQFLLPDGTSLENALQQPGRNASRDPGQWEYAVAVQWKKTVPLPEAKTFRGVFANQNVVCKLGDPATVAFVREHFGIPTANGADA